MRATKCAVFVLHDFEPVVQLGVINVDQVPQRPIVFHNSEPNSGRRRSKLLMTHMETSKRSRLLMPSNVLWMA